MAFTFTIQSVIPTSDGTGAGTVYNTTVVFGDSVSGYTSTRTYNFALNANPVTVITQITADATAIKTSLAAAGLLAASVGRVVTV